MTRTAKFIFVAVIIFMASPLEAVMVDRPGQLLDLARQLATNIQAAEKATSTMRTEIEKRTEKLREIEKELKRSNLSRAKRLELQAMKNRLEREETRYRRQALALVKEQMDGVFSSLERMQAKIQDLQAQEATVDPNVVQAFNKYFRASAQLIKNSTTGARGVSGGTLAMLETLERSLIISDKTTNFLARAEKQICEYKKIVALYNSQLLYLSHALEKYGHVLANERDAITITVSLETASRFMDELNIEEMEDAIMKDFSRQPMELLTESEMKRYNRRVIRGVKSEENLNRYSSGQVLTIK
jgi:chromosome segregation ATPase